VSSHPSTQRVSVGSAATSPSLDVAICTYNNADQLGVTLEHLSRQNTSADCAWRVLIVDNNCTDHTAEVIARHRRCGRLPALDVVSQPAQGLTPARRMAVETSAADFVAFVDDDCRLAADWVEQAWRFARHHPAAGAFGGKVRLVGGARRSPLLDVHGWLFAAQSYAAARREVDALVGAGLVLRRQALIDSGWLAEPLLADRIGRRLVSGGDVEISLRLAAAGFRLWYTDTLALEHFSPQTRRSALYLTRLAYGLGRSSVLVALLANSDWAATERNIRQREAKWRRILARPNPFKLPLAALAKAKAIEAAFLAGLGSGRRALTADVATRGRLQARAVPQRGGPTAAGGT
jgi:GT2 family glycosyltransferase